MPFKSESQRRFMFAKHPVIARRWAGEYPASAKGDLQERVVAGSRGVGGKLERMQGGRGR